MKTTKEQRHYRRTHRVRAKITGTEQRPRLAVYRTHRAISVQIINDMTGKTLVFASSRELKKSTDQKPVAVAAAVGELVAQKAKAAKIDAVRFDRRRYQYHGRIKALADGARKAGLQF